MRENKTMQRLLAGESDNHILPFFWQHGEDEATLREYMGVIHAAGCGAVCIESRPHPDFCGPKWWADMDVILDEARKRSMQVWILDDSHFPTGYANGAMANEPDSLCRQNIFCATYALPQAGDKFTLNLREAGLLQQPPQKLTGFAAFLNTPPARTFDDDSILCVSAQNETGDRIDLTEHLQGETVTWTPPTGAWALQICVRSRNTGCHRNYINMTEENSCRILLDAVYEPHWQHYAADFGTTIAGFFSDEPELGNNMLYVKENRLGTEQDLPWGDTLERQVKRALGAAWPTLLPLLWQEGDAAQTAFARATYMDLLTKRVRQAFSYQLCDWCHAHGVQYIGHMIEDQGQHARTGSGLGHYFRGLQGQDMAGIDDIGGQVLPQGEAEPLTNSFGAPRSGEFYHYTLAKLAASAAAIEPNKRGNAMCEIFGNYGWQEGVRLEKYLADHFLVRGINQFVPHAFSAAPFPDPDCPPHFYAHGHNPQYRHFGALLRYMNRVATLTSSGKHAVPVGVLYHAEAEWADAAPPMQVDAPLHALYDAQIDAHILPADIFSEPDLYQTKIGSPLTVNGQQYHAFVVPRAENMSRAAVEGLSSAAQAGLPIFFVEQQPQRVIESGAPLPAVLRQCPVIALSDLPQAMRSLPLALPKLCPANDRVRILHINSDTAVYLLVNEGASPYRGEIVLPSGGDCYGYDAWSNQCYVVPAEAAARGTKIHLTIEPMHSAFIVFGTCPGQLAPAIPLDGEIVPCAPWMRSTCEGGKYPAFEAEKPVKLPDRLAEEAPEFSGFVRYTTRFSAEEGAPHTLVIADAAEGVEVFCNGVSAGIQIAPPFVYNLSNFIQQGENTLAVEVATTLERRCYPLLQGLSKRITPAPASGSGMTGAVQLYRCK